MSPLAPLSTSPSIPEPVTHPIPLPAEPTTSRAAESVEIEDVVEIREVKLLDRGEAEDAFDIDGSPAAIDAEARATSPDLQAEHADPAAGPRVGAPSASTPPPSAYVRRAFASDGETSASSDVQVKPRLKSILVKPPKVLTPPAGRRKTVWKRVELVSLAVEESMAQRALRPMAPANQQGKTIYSPPSQLLGERRVLRRC